MRIGLAVAAALGITLAAAGRADANLITYTQTTVASGTLGGSSFTDADLTMVATADTAAVTGGSGFFEVPNISLLVTIAGLGTATFTEPTRTFVNQGFVPPAAGSAGVGSSILDTLHDAFATYDLTTSIGPITGAPFIRSDIFYATDMGDFNLTAAGDVTFTANTVGVPEPSTLAVSGIAGLLAIGYGLRRRRASA